jgi:4'-phosphopantetheinyl transferase
MPGRDDASCRDVAYAEPHRPAESRDRPAEPDQPSRREPDDPSRVRAAARAWAHGPARAPLEPREVHVWRADLAVERADPLVFLSPHERERAGRILNPRKRELWMRSRALLRSLLARYLEIAPRELEFGANVRGKPVLVGAEPALHFSLSHSGQLALYAFASAGPVGVDVELVRGGARPRNAVAIAARAFGRDAAERLRALDANARELEFLRLWARREAELKRGAPSRSRVRACSGGVAGGSGAAGEDPTVVTIDIGARGSAAVALPRPDDEATQMVWSA